MFLRKQLLPHMHDDDDGFVYRDRNVVMFLQMNDFAYHV